VCVYVCTARVAAPPMANHDCHDLPYELPSELHTQGHT
jgi:hypothetical protein